MTIRLYSFVLGQVPLSLYHYFYYHYFYYHSLPHSKICLVRPLSLSQTTNFQGTFLTALQHFLLFFADSSRSLLWCLLRTVHMLRTGHQQGLGSQRPDLEPHGYGRPACCFFSDYKISRNFPNGAAAFVLFFLQTRLALCCGVCFALYI